MKIVSVNVGLPREVNWRGAKVLTGIFKDPVDGPVMVHTLNLDGDRQADLTVHGGAEKAVYAYPAEHYDYWRKQLPNVTLPWGQFGENLTTEGLLEDTLHIGDRLRVGSTLLTVTQPRMPCYKLGIKFQRDDMVKRFLASGRTGFYFSVEEEGQVQAGSEVEILSRDPNQVAAADITRLYVSHTPDADLLRRALNTVALPQSWKTYLVERAQARSRA
jgi:MOSC domain-containing protein YiiM